MKKTDLVKLIRESVASALTEWDEGDVALQQGMKADQVMKQTDVLLDSLKALTKALYRKQDPASVKMLQAINMSLEGFVQKVTSAVRGNK